MITDSFDLVSINTQFEVQDQLCRFYFRKVFPINVNGLEKNFVSSVEYD